VKRFSVGVLLGLLLVSCHDDTTTSQSLGVRIVASNPAFPAAPQTISVDAYL